MRGRQVNYTVIRRMAPAFALHLVIALASAGAGGYMLATGPSWGWLVAGILCFANLFMAFGALFAVLGSIIPANHAEKDQTEM